MKDGNKYIDKYGVVWILRGCIKRWRVWNEELGYGVWDHGRGLNFYAPEAKEREV